MENTTKKDSIKKVSESFTDTFTNTEKCKLESLLSENRDYSKELCCFSVDEEINDLKKIKSLYSGGNLVGGYDCKSVSSWEKAVETYNNTSKRQKGSLYVPFVTEALKYGNKEKTGQLIRIIDLYRNKLKNNYIIETINGAKTKLKLFIEGDKLQEFVCNTEKCDTLLFENTLYYSDNINYKHKESFINIGDVVDQQTAEQKEFVGYNTQITNRLIENLSTAEKDLDYMHRLLNSNILAKTILGADKIISLHNSNNYKAILQHLDPAYISSVITNRQKYKSDIIYAISTEKLKNIANDLNLVSVLDSNYLFKKYNWKLLYCKNSQNFINKCWLTKTYDNDCYSEEDYARNYNILYLPCYDYRENAYFSMQASVMPGKIDDLNLSTRILRDLAVNLEMRKNSFLKAKTKLESERNKILNNYFTKINKCLLLNNQTQKKDEKFDRDFFRDSDTFVQSLHEKHFSELIDNIATVNLKYTISLAELEFKDWSNNIMKKIGYEKKINDVILNNLETEIHFYESSKLRKYREKIKSFFNRSNSYNVYEQQLKYKNILINNSRIIENILNIFSKIQKLRKSQYTLLRLQKHLQQLINENSSELTKTCLLSKIKKCIDSYELLIEEENDRIIQQEYDSNKYKHNYSDTEKINIFSSIQQTIKNTIALDSSTTIENILGKEYYVRNGYLSYYNNGWQNISNSLDNKNITLKIFINNNENINQEDLFSKVSSEIDKKIDTQSKYGDGYCKFKLYKKTLVPKIYSSLENNENIHIIGKSDSTSIAQYFFYQTLKLIKNNNINYTGRIIIELDAPIGIPNNKAKIIEQLLDKINLVKKPIVYIFYGIGDKSILSGNVLGIDYANKYIDYRSKIFLNKLYVTPLEAHCGYLMSKILCNQKTTDSYTMAIQDPSNFPKLKSILFPSFFTNEKINIPNQNSVYNVFELLEIKEKIQPYKTHKQLIKTPTFLTLESFALLAPEIQKIICQSFDIYTDQNIVSNVKQKILEIKNEYEQNIGIYKKGKIDFETRELYPFSQQGLFYLQQKKQYLQTTN